MQGQTSILDVAWATGLFEGEGCFGAYQRKRPHSQKWQVTCRLTMTDRDVVERFAAIMGCGHVRGPIVDSRPNHKDKWEWYVCDSVKIRACIALMLPLLGERRTAKALEVDAVCATIRPHNQQLTHCPHGHELKGENVQHETIVRAGKTYEARRCRTCRTAQGRVRARRAKGIKPENYRKP